MLLRVVRFVERLQRYINARTLKAARSCAAAQHGSSGGGTAVACRATLPVPATCWAVQYLPKISRVPPTGLLWAPQLRRGWLAPLGASRRTPGRL